MHLNFELRLFSSLPRSNISFVWDREKRYAFSPAPQLQR